MCEEHFDDYIFSIVLINNKLHDSRTIQGQISVLNGNENDLDLIYSKFKNFLDITFGGETC